MMIYCVHCNLDFSGMELENDKCPKCKYELKPITNNRLANILTEINSAMHRMKGNTLTTNPMNIIEIANIIEKGEKKLSKEYHKRLEQMNDLNYELMVIDKFAEQMKYKLGADE